VPHIWLPMKSNPSPWTPKKPGVKNAVEGEGATFNGLYCKTADPAQAYMLAEVSDQAHGKRVRKALQSHGTLGQTVYLDEV
jgi:hypothetical protein